VDIGRRRLVLVTSVVTTLGVGAPDAYADSLILSRFGHTEAQSIAITPAAAGDSNEERFDIEPGEGPFTFDEAPSPPDASSSGEEGTADASAGAVFHAAASEDAAGALRITASGAAEVSASVTDVDSESSSSHFAEGSALSTVSVRFEVRDGAKTFRISGSASGNTFAELRDDSGVLIRIVPGSPAFGVTGTLEPGTYELEFEMDLEVEAQAPGDHDVDDNANGDVTLTVGVPDADGDGLADEWEEEGVDVDGNGTIDLDLPGLGADPLHKDIFVELDFMPPHRFSLAAGNEIAKAFADAPVTNPDGTSGIALHLDNGSDSVMNPRTGALWGGRSAQSSITHQDVLGSVTGNQYDWGPFDTLKGAHFPSARRTVFHYAISAHGHDGRVSGVARGIPSSDLLVTLGAGCLFLTGADCTLDSTSQAGTLMHELGHNLGLHHGGDDDLLNKPNYLSVMNYSFQLTGLMRSDLTYVLDYSRFGLPIDERALDEGVGFGATSGPAAFNTTGFCPSGARTVWSVAAGPTNFNCDATTGGMISADINGDGLQTALPPFIDWPALVFDGGGIGGSGVTLPSQTEVIEPPLDELLTAKTALDEFVAAGRRPKDPEPSVTPAPTAAPLAVTSLAVRPSRFPAARSGGSIAARRGATVRYTLSAAARVRFTVERLLPGRVRRGRCRPPTSPARGKRCLRRVRVTGRFQHVGVPGANSFRFTGRLGGRALKAGSYRLIATPIASDGSPGGSRAASFNVRPSVRAPRSP
jgi:hypothetical protein